VLVSHGDWQCERHCLGLSGDDLVVGVDQLDPNLVLPDRQTGDVDHVAGIDWHRGKLVTQEINVPRPSLVSDAASRLRR
jgi:hypothetical protein